MSRDEQKTTAKLDLLKTMDGIVELHKAIDNWPFSATIPIQTLDELEILSLQIAREVIQYRKNFLTKNGLVGDRK